MSMPLGRLNSGDLRTRITINRKVQADNGRGGYTESWQAVASPWAEVQGQDGREALIGQALQGISTYRIRIRFRTDLTSADQIGLPDGRQLNISSITDPNGRREQLMILATTASAQATA